MTAVGAVPLTRNSRWWRWTVSAGASRLPPAMAALALVFLGQEATGSYVGGAVLAGTFAISEAVFAPGRGRALDRLTGARRRRGLRWTLYLSAVLLAALAVAGQAHAPLPVLIALTVAAAGVPAGVQGGYRALLAEILDPGLHSRAFSWDAALLEIEWLIAPLFVTLALLSGHPAAAVGVMAAWSLAAALLTHLVPESSAAGTVPGPGGTAPARVWRRSAVWPTLLVSAGLGAGEGGLIAGLPPLLGDLGGTEQLAGLFAGALAAASAVGGLVVGAVGDRLPGTFGRQSEVALIIMSVLFLPAVVVGSPLWLLLPMVAGGLLIAPVNTFRTRAMEHVLPASMHSEGFSLQYGINGLGTAAGAGIVAVLLGAGAAVAVGATLVLALVLAVAAVVLSRFTPERVLE